MNQVVALVQQKTGLSQEMAQKVVDVVVDHIKGKLPAPMASGLDSLLGAGEATAGADASATEQQGSGLADTAKSMVAGLFNKSEG